jgi:MFS family permease
VALIAPSLFWYGLVFILFAAALSANNLSRLAIMLEFAPADSRPTYVGLASVAAAPTAFIGPLFGGWLADHFGFPIPFAMFWVACVFGLAVLIRRVQEPRNVRHSGRIVEPVDEEALSTPGG